MKRKMLLGVACLWPLACAAADQVQPLNVKLGLWETTTTVQMSGAPPIPAEMLEKLSPEQRAKLEAAMKARQTQGPSTTVRKECLTKEKLDKSLAFGGENRQSCKQTIVSATGSKEDIRVECTGEIKGSGEIHVEALNSENVQGSMHMTANAAGATMHTQSTFKARWLGASCGTTK